jgi:CMP/dCMP kinase
MKTRTTITIARQMGSGGAYVGRIIASRLGLKYVDREVLRLAAQSLGVEESILEGNKERVSSLWERIFGCLSFGPPETRYVPPPVRNFTDEEQFEKQVEALRLIARQENCVIIGWGGAYVIPHHPRMVNLYFHAPLRFRIRRVMELYDITDKHEAGRMIEESDARRKKYFAEMTDKDWACADNYHLSIDTSIYPLPELADKLINFIERKFGDRPSS